MRMFKLFLAAALCGQLLSLTEIGAVAETLPMPKDPVVLTVSGAIEMRNGPDGAAFDNAMLREMPQQTYVTTTIWTEGEKTFVGVPLAAVLDRLGASEGTVRAQAINDYAVDIPIASVEATAPIIAYEMDGATMSRRDKGPLWIVYPYDADEKYRSETVYSRSIWQLDRIAVVQ